MQTLHMSRQAVLNRVYTSLWWQNGQSVGKDEQGVVCMYRGPEGAKCGIGHLIEDENYSPMMERMGIGRLVQTGHLDIEDTDGIRGDVYEKFLQEIQYAHDDCDSKLSPFRYQLNVKFKNIASQYGLNFSPLDPEVHISRM